MISRVLGLCFICLSLSGAYRQPVTMAQRSPAEYVEEINQLLRDAGRADISNAEGETRRTKAQQLAAQYAATLRASNPTGADRHWLGYLYHLADDKEKALAAFREVLDDKSLIEEEKQQARLYLVRSLSEAGNVAEAEAILAAMPTSAFNVDETRADAHELLAVAYTKQGQLEKAIEQEEKALEAARKSGLIPRIWMIGRALSQLYVALDRRDDGINVLKGLLEFFNRQIRYSGGQPSEALERAVKEMNSGLAQIDMIGKPAPEITTVKWIGEPATTLAAQRGKVVLLELWASWCPDCRGMIPHLRDWHTRYSAQGLKIVAVTRYFGFNGQEVGKATPAQEEAFLTKFKQMQNMPYGTGIDNESKSFDTYHVAWIPHIVIIDRAGMIQFVYTWDDNPALCEYVVKRVLAGSEGTGN